MQRIAPVPRQQSMRDLQHQHRVLFRFQMTDPRDLEAIRFGGGEQRHIDTVRNDVRPRHRSCRLEVREQQFCNVLSDGDQAGYARPVDSCREIRLHRFDGMQPHHTRLAREQAGIRHPHCMIPAPFQPHDIGPRDGFRQAVVAARGHEACFVLGAECGHQRCEEALALILDAIKQQQAACHGVRRLSAGCRARPCGKRRSGAWRGSSC